MCLDAAQLVKHLLGIHTAVDVGTLAAPASLMVLYWRPTVAGRYTTLFERLESEVADLADRLDDQRVALVARSTASLLQDWSSSETPWLREHASHLRARYDPALPDA